MAFISLTSLTLNSFIHVPAFWYHAIRSHRACVQSSGIIKVKLRGRKMTYETMTAWQDRQEMMKFLAHPHHVAAMKWSKQRATGSVFHYQSEVLPDWKTAEALIKNSGRRVQSLEQ